MLLEVVRLILVGVLLLVVPGYLLLSAIHPRRENASFTVAEQAYLVVVGSLVLVTCVGLVLGFMPHSGSTGWFRTFATGAPHAEMAILLVCAVLFYVGLMRGAYPAVEARFPQLVAR